MSDPDDPFFEALASHARAEAAAVDPRWSALARGELDDEARAALEAEAATDPRSAAALEAFTPLGAEFEARVVDRLLAELQPEAMEAPATQGAQIIPFRRRARRALWVAAPLAAAAALTFYLTRPHEVEAPPVPEYGLTFSGGEKPMRGRDPLPDGPPTLEPDSRLRVVLTPDAAIEGAVAVRAFVLRGGEARPWAPALQIAPSGAILLQGTPTSLGLGDAGPATLVFAVGRAEALPEASAVGDAVAAPPSGASPWRLLTVDVVLVK